MCKRLALLLSMLLICSVGFCQTRYWVASSAGNWSDSNNWSVSNGGAGGASIPSTTDRVIFNSNGLGNCSIDLSLVEIEGLLIGNSYTSQLNIGTSTISINGNSQVEFNAGDIIASGPGSKININTSDDVLFTNNGGVFDCDFEIVSSRASFSGGVFNGKVKVTVSPIAALNGDGLNTFNDSLIVTNLGSSNFLTSRNNPDIYNGPIKLSNQGTGLIRMSFEGIGTEFNNNIIVESTGGGILFGEGEGSATLADGYSIFIGDQGFSQSDLRFEDFTQLGNTLVNINLDGTARLVIEDSEIGGELNVVAPRIQLRTSIFNSNVSLEKILSGNSDSHGGNIFHGDLSVENSGTSRTRFQLSAPDTCYGNAVFTNSGSHQFFLAMTPDNYFAGDLELINSASSSRHIYLANQVGSGVTVEGNTIGNNFSLNSGSHLYICTNGNGTFNGNLDITNNSEHNCQIFIANNQAGEVNINGQTRISNLGTSGNTQRIYFANNGSAILNGDFHVTNASNGSSSQIFINHTTSSSSAINGNIYLNSINANARGIYFGSSGGQTELGSGHTLNIGSGGYISGILELSNIRQIGNVAQNLILTGSSDLQLENCEFDGSCSFESPRIRFEQSTFHEISSIEKTGASDDSSFGNNIFDKSVTFTNSGTAQFRIAATNPDVYSENVTLINSGSSRVYFPYTSVGNVVSGDLTVINSSSIAGASPQIRISDSENSDLIVMGDVSIENNHTDGSSITYLGVNGDVVINGDLSILNNSNSSFSRMTSLLNETASLRVEGATIIENNSTAADSRMFINARGQAIFNGPVTALNNSGTNLSAMYFNHFPESLCEFNGDIVVECTAVNSDGIRFGEGQGFATLRDAQTISVGPNGFIAGDLRLRNFTQLGTSIQNINMGGLSRLYLYGSTFNGPINTASPRILIQENIFNETADLEKTGAFNDASLGLNTFNANVTFRNSGTSYFMTSNTQPNNYEADVTYIQTSTGIFHESHKTASTFAGDIYFDLTSTFNLANSSGRVVLDGTTAQSINDLGSSTVNFRRMTVSNVNGVDLNMPMRVSTELLFDQGELRTTNTNLLRINNDAIVNGASHSSYVNGPIVKYGNDAFEFPVGKNGLFRPISMTAPSSTAAQFRAEYFDTNPNDTYSASSKDPSIHHISSTEYWLLDRLATNNSVDVILSWEDPSSGEVSDLSDLLVCRWDGTKWTDHGNGSTTGSITNGTITSASAITSFSPFTLGSATIENPLPIELLSFEALLLNTNVELKWITSSEINNDYFEIERSDNGYDWVKIDFVDGAGNSNSNIFYRTIDYNPLPGINYYRLNQTDFDGTFSYSDVVSVHNFDEDQLFELYPNPTFSDVKLVLSKSDSAEQLRIYNSTGQIIHQQEIKSLKREHVIPFNSFKPGVYLVKVKIGGSWKTKRLIKSK